MNGDPERLLSASSADPLERELLGSVRHVGPPEGAKDEAWRAIAGQLAVAAAVGVAAGSSTAAAKAASAGTVATWGIGAKVAAVVAASGIALGGGYVALQMARPEPPGVAPHSAVQAPAKPAPAKPVVAPAPVEPLPAVVAAEEAPSKRPEAPRPDLLKAESSLLTEARAQLRAGNAAAAQAALDKLAAQMPKGILMQEREVLAIEVLSARGNADAAKRRAKAFVKAYPNSPHSAKLARFVE